jgi:hypothetical protein
MDLKGLKKSVGPMIINTNGCLVISRKWTSHHLLRQSEIMECLGACFTKLNGLANRHMHSLNLCWVKLIQAIYSHAFYLPVPDDVEKLEIIQISC